MAKLNSDQIARLSEAAWRVRKAAHIYGKTAVGAALLTLDDQVFAGCNVEHKFRSHDVHAEVNAITSMVSAGQKSFTAILIAADRELFTPCGGCMDWIFQFGGPNCFVGFQPEAGRDPFILRAKELMPFYPA